MCCMYKGTSCVAIGTPRMHVRYKDLRDQSKPIIMYKGCLYNWKGKIYMSCKFTVLFIWGLFKEVMHTMDHSSHSL